MLIFEMTGKEIVKYIASVFSIALSGLGNKIYEFFIEIENDYSEDIIIDEKSGLPISNKNNREIFTPKLKSFAPLV